MEFIAGELYFVREREFRATSFTNYVKIGLVHEKEGRSSLDRLREHQTGNPRELVLPPGNVLFTDAIDRVEALMHNLYATQRVSGEWFLFANESEIEAAKARAEKLAEEVRSYLPIFTKAAELEKILDDGSTKEPNDEVRALCSQIVEARGRLKALKKLEDMGNAVLKMAKADGKELGSAAKEVSKVYKGKFDLERFKSENPEMYANFEFETVSWQQRFLFKPKAHEVDALNEEFKTLIAQLETEIAASNEDLSLLNEPMLTITREKAIAAWQDSLAIAELKVICAEHQSITDTCTWVRKNVTATTFDTARFKAEHNDLFEKYVGEDETKSYVQKATKKI